MNRINQLMLHCFHRTDILWITPKPTMPPTRLSHGKRTDISFVEFVESEHSPDDPLEHSLLRLRQQRNAIARVALVRTC